MAKNIFADAFNIVLEQDAPTGAEAAGQVTPPAETTPSNNTSDLGAASISPEDQAVLQHAANRELKMVNSLNSWITELDRIVEYLNGTSDGSIQMTLKKAVPDTIFDKMRNAEAKKIARVAKEISALAETFKGYAATSDNPSYRFVSWFIGSLLPFAAALTSFC